jgi:hypothetical protein
VLLVGGGAVITFLGARAVWAATRPRPGATEPCPPYTWDPTAVSATIASLIDQGGMSLDEVAAAAATEHYGSHPSGAVASFPATNGLVGAACIYEKVYELTQQIWAQSDHEDIDYNALVSEFESPDGAPEMGTVYSYGPEISAMSMVARRTLQAAGIPSGSDNRIAYMRLIECSPYNDALYNVKLSDQAFHDRFRNDQPYGISGYPQHYDNLLRMKQGLPPRRAALRNHMSQTSEPVPGGRRHADFWLPLLKPGTEIVGPNAVATWQDGSSAINPPTELLALGFENVPAGDYGCAPWTTRVESL